VQCQYARSTGGAGREPVSREPVRCEPAGWIPASGAALAAGEISESYARKVADWSDQLPEANRQDCDQILLAAHAGGADLADVAALAEEMLSLCAPPDTDDDCEFTDRSVRLDCGDAL
jgi:hypothetical protein